MATGRDAVLRQVRTLFDLGATRELTDGQLLERFVVGGDEGGELAFAALVERHGPMVLRVCRGVLPDAHDCQDAFQATFLVLVRRARGLWVRDSIGPWLHQVAVRTAAAARAAAARRRRHERLAAEGRAGEETPPEPRDDGEAVLHAEIARLPERFRVPIVLCDLEGRSHEQAARHLGWAVGTVKSRQARGRARLRGRLTRLGLAPAAVPTKSVPAEERAGVSPALVAATASAAARSLSSPWLTASGGPAALAGEVLRTMTLARWLHAVPVALAVALGTGLTATGARLLARDDPPAAQAATPAAPKSDIPSANPRRGTFRFAIKERGSVEAESVAELNSQVEGHTTILSILPEGTKVKKGDLVAELDSSSLRDRLVNQRVATGQAETQLRRAEASLQAAELALKGYVDGSYPEEVLKVKGELALARAEREEAEARLERVARARERLAALRNAAQAAATATAETDLDDRAGDARLRRLSASLAEERASARLRVLERFTKEQQTRTLQSEVERRRSDVLSATAAHDLEKLREDKIRRQIASCRLVAPAEGLVLYANNYSPNGPEGRLQIEEGATVSERQKIVSIPDLSRQLVNVKAQEAFVDKLRPGQKVQVSVDAFPGETLTGEVRTVAPLPDRSLRVGQGVKYYTTMVKLDRTPPGLRPGMTALAEIVVAEHADALTVPVNAVVIPSGPRRARRTDQGFVAVIKPGGGFEWRAVTVGMSNGDDVEIKEGLKEGEPIAADAQSLPPPVERPEKPAPGAPELPRR